jgi:hypothetical protein
VGEPDAFEELGDAGLPLGRRHATERQRQADGFGRAKIRGQRAAVVLLDDPDPIAPVRVALPVGRVGEVAAEHGQSPGRRSIEAGDQPQQRRLARPGRPDDRGNLADVDPDIEPAECGDRATR